MNTLTIKLKQHTPLIHFQHDQEDATLRASEVKPRLDKYIITQLGEGDYEKGKAKAKANGWLVGKGEHPALDYKMRIFAVTKMKDFPLENNRGRSCYPSFFANQNAEPDKIKKIIFPQKERACEDIDIIISTPTSPQHALLEKEIKRFSDDFFLVHNFGTRQTKGFGSFFPIDKSIRNIEDNRIKKFYRFTISIPIENNNWERVYQQLDERLSFFYKTLRSGINIEPFYFKSLMFFYAIQKEMYYDKRKIREHYHLFTDRTTGRYTNNENVDKGEKFEKDFCPQYNSDNARLYRDMLGLSSSQAWMKYNKAIISKENNSIERYNSPLTIKPIITTITSNSIEFIVLIIPSVIPDDYFNQIFTIKQNKNDHNSFPLSTPSKDKFDLDEFLRYSLYKDEAGYNEALRQLQQKDYEQWKTNYVSSQENYKSCKQKLERKFNRKNINDDEIRKELDNEAKKKIYKSEETTKILAKIFKDIHCPE